MKMAALKASWYCHGLKDNLALETNIGSTHTLFTVSQFSLTDLQTPILDWRGLVFLFHFGLRRNPRGYFARYATLPFSLLRIQ